MTDALPTPAERSIKLLIELTIDPEIFDLSGYIDQAVADGWGREPENGVWYLAQEIADEHSARGCDIELIP